MAMWGAPQPQADHPALACAAALEMLDALPAVSQRWRDLLGEDTEVGIGLNTGVACVGNVGSTRKFKYGPLGATVNLASRIQGTTKYLKAKLVLGAATRARLGPEFEIRRLCTARVVNILEPVELYELRARGGSGFGALRDRYEKALEEFEHARFQEAARLLGEVLAHEPADGPTLALMSRTLEAMRRPGVFEPVWQLPGK
jgi:adenylate cyclase